MYIYEQDLALNNLQALICLKTQPPTNQKTTVGTFVLVAYAIHWNLQERQVRCWKILTRLLGRCCWLKMAFMQNITWFLCRNAGILESWRWFYQHLLFIDESSLSYTNKHQVFYKHQYLKCKKTNFIFEIVHFFYGGDHSIMVIIIESELSELNSWMTLFAFHIVLIPSGKVWTQLSYYY